MDTQKLQAFATAVGIDIKSLNNEIKTKITLAEVQQEIQNATSGVISEQSIADKINVAKNELKEEIMGQGVPETLDTFKEIAEKVANLDGDAQAALIAKVTELGTKIDNLSTVDLVAVYTQAKE